MIEMIKPRERVDDDEARAINPCDYPNCEECDKYVTNSYGAFCTVPIVVSKQMYHLMTAEIRLIRGQISDVEHLLTTMLITPTEANSVTYGLPDEEG